MINELEPFGEPGCESELERLGSDEYQRYYFQHTPFNEKALDRQIYLIIGRRGSGKTALGHFFSFQEHIPHAAAIDVDEPAVFHQVMTKLATGAAQTREMAVPRLVSIWEYVIWSIIFQKFRDRDPRIKAACVFDGQTEKVSTFVLHVLMALGKKYLNADNSLADEFETILNQQSFKTAKAVVIELAKKKSIIIAIDTLENYAIHDETFVWIMAALIECASKFETKYGSSNIHIKLFIMAEIFPYLKEEAISNVLKFVRNPLYLHWRPKDLMRLISWRYWRYLRANGYLNHVPPNKINWDDHHAVLRDCWNYFFGAELQNQDGFVEKTLIYVLRHTQMRPRQLIVLCNSIARSARDRGSFPRFTQDDIIRGIQQAEEDLADEVFNSYSSVYPNVAGIAEALSGMPLLFKGKVLDKCAPKTAALWTGDYSPVIFKRLLTELGIVGRVRRINRDRGVIEADFEYTLRSRLPLLSENDDCVIHPMFYKRLNIKKVNNLCVYPFPDHEDFR